ncbi:MAG: hypothetical protein JKY65_21950 [Planctomycetes bacterium]|nr:hypothetical protein [Planctomycetota bacterium]
MRTRTKRAFTLGVLAISALLQGCQSPGKISAPPPETGAEPIGDAPAEPAEDAQAQRDEEKPAPRAK